MGSERRPDHQGFHRPGYGIQTVHGAYVALSDGPSVMSQVFGFEFSRCRVRDRVSKAGLSLGSDPVKSQDTVCMVWVYVFQMQSLYCPWEVLWAFKK